MATPIHYVIGKLYRFNTPLSNTLSYHYDSGSTLTKLHRSKTYRLESISYTKCVNRRDVKSSLSSFHNVESKVFEFRESISIHKDGAYNVKMTMGGSFYIESDLIDKYSPELIDE